MRPTTKQTGRSAGRPNEKQTHEVNETVGTTNLGPRQTLPLLSSPSDPASAPYRSPHAAAAAFLHLRFGPGRPPPAPLVAPPWPDRRRRGHLLRRFPCRRAAPHALLLRVRANRNFLLLILRPQPRPRRTHPGPRRRGEGRA